MSQWVKHLMCKLEDPSSDPQSPGKAEDCGTYVIQCTYCEMGDGRIYAYHMLASLAYTSESRKKKKKRETLPKQVGRCHG